MRPLALILGFLIVCMLPMQPFYLLRAWILQLRFWRPFTAWQGRMSHLVQLNAAAEPKDDPKPPVA